MLNPLVEAQGKHETDNCTVANVMAYFGELYSSIAIIKDKNLSESVIEKLESRWQTFLTVDLMILSAALDHSLNPSIFKSDEKISWAIIAEFAEKYYSKLFREPQSLVMYKNGERPFLETTINKVENPFFFWQVLKTNTENLYCC